MNTGYRIGAVAKLTGISTDTIRAWERRYGVVEPNRGENNNRYYSDIDVTKLLSVKRLVDAGQAIGTICSLSEEELTQRTTGLLGISQKMAATNGERWGVFSVQRPQWLKDCVSRQSDGEISWFSELTDINFDKYDFMVIDMPSLSEVNEREIVRNIPPREASKCLVVYRFASRNQLRSLTDLGFKLLKGPLEPYALVNLLGEKRNSADRVSPRRYTESQLGRLGTLTGSVECDCPKHLSELIISLNQFEDYSADCVSKGGEEAEMHERLLKYTSRARTIMEDALADIVEVEGYGDHIN